MKDRQLVSTGLTTELDEHSKYKEQLLTGIDPVVSSMELIDGRLMKHWGISSAWRDIKKFRSIWFESTAEIVRSNEKVLSFEELADNKTEKLSHVARQFTSDVRLADVIYNRVRPSLLKAGEWDNPMRDLMYSISPFWLGVHHTFEKEKAPSYLADLSQGTTLFQVANRISSRLSKERRSIGEDEYLLLSSLFLRQIRKRSEGEAAGSLTLLNLDIYLNSPFTEIQSAFSKERGLDTHDKSAISLITLLSSFSIQTLEALADPENPRQERAIEITKELARQYKDTNATKEMMRGIYRRSLYDRNIDVTFFLKGIREQALYGDDPWFMQMSLEFEKAMRELMPDKVFDALELEELIGVHDMTVDKVELLALAKKLISLSGSQMVAMPLFAGDFRLPNYNAENIVASVMIIKGKNIVYEMWVHKLNSDEYAEYIQSDNLSPGIKKDIQMALDTDNDEIAVTPLVVDLENITPQLQNKIDACMLTAIYLHIESIKSSQVTKNPEVQNKFLPGELTVPITYTKGPSQAPGKKQKNNNQTVQDHELSTNAFTAEIEARRTRPRLLMSPEVEKQIINKITEEEGRMLRTKIDHINKGLGRMSVLKDRVSSGGYRILSFRLSRKIRILAEWRENNEAYLYDVIWRREL